METIPGSEQYLHLLNFHPHMQATLNASILFQKGLFLGIIELYVMELLHKVLGREPYRNAFVPAVEKIISLQMIQIYIK